MRDDRFIWRERYDAPRGEIYLSPEEQAFGASHAGRLIVEPNLKAAASPNKDWGWDRWQALVKLAPDLPWTQLGAPGAQRLRGVQFVETQDFRRAAAILAHAAGYVGHEGAMHHASAALNRPAVVLFGGFISPALTGYAGHINLFTGGEPCGWRKPCAHCRVAMQQITPEMVRSEVLGMLKHKEAA